MKKMYVESAQKELCWRHVHQIDSTNAALLDDAQPCNQLLSADTQTKGRGRHNQPWIDDGSSALFSLSTSYPKGLDISAWPVHVGVTLATALNVLIAKSHQPTEPPPIVKVKWPNDLYVLRNGTWGKCAGILVESCHGQHGKVVTGVGLNLASLKHSITADYRVGFIDVDIDKKKLICLLGKQLFSAWAAFVSKPAVCTQSYQQLDYLYGKSLTATDMRDGRVIRGIGAGINELGHLRVDDGERIHDLYAQQRIRLLDMAGAKDD